MQNLDAIKIPTEIESLVAFFDLTSFTQLAQQRSSLEVFQLLNEIYEFSGDIIEAAGGTVIKYIGDAGLVMFAKDNVDAGVIAMKQVQEQGDEWLKKRNIRSRIFVKIHYGPLIYGPLGSRTDKRVDIIGNTVNTAALLKTNGFAMSAQVFRKLAPSTRKLFKKHSLPITYIPVDMHHRT